MEPASDRAYRRMRNDIISGVLGAGHRLAEADLAQSYGSSRTPIREALRRLQAEGLVETQPHKGARVVDWDAVDIEGIYQMRAVIEGLVARRAAARISKEQINQLREVCNEIEVISAQMSDGDTDHVEKIANLNSSLHGTVADIAGGYQIKAVRDNVVVLPLVLRMLWGGSQEDQRRSNQHHRELLRAFEAGDPDWAASVMHSHVHHGKQILLRNRGQQADREEQ